jgi:protein-disulfide isomerase
MIMVSSLRRLALLATSAFVLAACGAQDGDRTPAQAGSATASAGYDLGFVKGDPNAPVTMIEYASPTCPACKYFHDSVMPALEEKYVATGKVRFIFREFPIHGQADIAAYVVARCAGPDKFFDVIDDLFENQDGIVQSANAGALRTTLKTVAARHGIETEEAFQACLDNPQHRNDMAAVYQTAEEFNVGGTPTFVLDGTVYNFEGDFRTVEGISRKIDALLAEKGAQ